VLEFEEFLKIKGCQTDKHLFTDATPLPALAHQPQQQQQEIRNDWYQSPTHVTVSIYVKSVDSNTVRVRFEEKKASLLTFE
jgi:hypothetical protein